MPSVPMKRPTARIAVTSRRRSSTARRTPTCSSSSPPSAASASRCDRATPGPASPSCTFDTAAEAAEILPEVGPVWDTHLRLLREAVGEPPSDVPEGELTGRYERLADQARREAESGGDEATEDSADGR